MKSQSPSSKNTDVQTNAGAEDNARVSSTQHTCRSSERGRSSAIPSSLMPFVTPKDKVVCFSAAIRDDDDWYSASSDSPMHFRHRAELLRRGNNASGVSSPRYPFCHDGAFVEEGGGIAINPEWGVDSVSTANNMCKKVTPMTRRGRLKATNRARLTLRRGSETKPSLTSSTRSTIGAPRRDSYTACGA